MSYYANQEKYRDRDFEKFFSAYSDRAFLEKINQIIDPNNEHIGGSLKPLDGKVENTYNDNIKTATGYDSHLYDLKGKLKTAEEKIETCESTISEKKKAVKAAIEKYKDAKRERRETSFFHRKKAKEAEKAAKESLEEAKKSKSKAKTALKEQKEKVASIKAQIADIEQQINVCQKNNKTLKTITTKYIELSTELKTKLPLLVNKIDLSAQITFEGRTCQAGVIFNELRDFSENLSLSVQNPLTENSPEIRMLHLLEQHVLAQHRQDYSDSLAQRQTEIQNVYEEYVGKKQVFEELRPPEGRDDNR